MFTGQFFNPESFSTFWSGTSETRIWFRSARTSSASASGCCTNSPPSSTTSTGRSSPTCTTGMPRPEPFADRWELFEEAQSNDSQFVIQQRQVLDLILKVAENNRAWELRSCRTVGWHGSGGSGVESLTLIVRKVFVTEFLIPEQVWEIWKIF